MGSCTLEMPHIKMPQKQASIERFLVRIEKGPSTISDLQSGTGLRNTQRKTQKMGMKGKVENTNLALVEYSAKKRKWE